MILKARAKINLFLHITGKTPSQSHHLLESLVAFAEDVYDELELSIAPKSFVKVVAGTFASEIIFKENILTKTLDILSLQKCYKIDLTKNIPIEAGLGGGSSDSGSLIKFLIEHEKILKNDIFYSKIGADIPCCIRQKSCYFSGIGEIIEEGITLPTLFAIFVKPKVNLNTTEVFKKFSKDYSSGLIRKPTKFSSSDALITFLKKQNNDLEEAAIEIFPEIKSILSKISNLEGCLLSRMTGSGSTCFGLFSSEDTMLKANKNLQSKYPNYWIRSSRLV